MEGYLCLRYFFPHDLISFLYVNRKKVYAINSDGKPRTLDDYGREPLHHENPLEAYRPPVEMDFDPVKLTCSDAYKGKASTVAGTIHHYTPYLPHLEHMYSDPNPDTKLPDTHEKKLLKLFSNARLSFEGSKKLDIHVLSKRLVVSRPMIDELTMNVSNKYMHFYL